MEWVDNPHWGVWPNLADEQGSTVSGEAPGVDHRDGSWCPKCLERGFYSWRIENSRCDEGCND